MEVWLIYRFISDADEFVFPALIDFGLVKKAGRPHLSMYSTNRNISSCTLTHERHAVSVVGLLVSAAKKHSLTLLVPSCLPADYNEILCRSVIIVIFISLCVMCVVLTTLANQMAPLGQ